MEDLYQQDNETDLVNRERELLIYQNENTNILDKISQYKSYKEKINSFISDSFEKINNIYTEMKNYKDKTKPIIDYLLQYKAKLNSNDNNNRRNTESGDIDNQESNYFSRELKEIDDILDYNATLDEFIKSLDGTKNKIEKIKIDNDSESSQSSRSLAIINKNQIFLNDISKKIDKENEKSSKNIQIIEESQFGLYNNKCELLKFNDDLILSMNILNNGNLKLRLLNKENLETKFEHQYPIFEEGINDFKCFSGVLQNNNSDLDDNIIENDLNNKRAYLLVSSKKNSLNAYQINFDFDEKQSFNIINNNPLIRLSEFNDNDQQNQNNNQNSLSLISFTLRINNNDPEIYICSSDGISIIIYSITGDSRATLILTEPLKINYCEIINEKYFVFCGNNENYQNTCAIRVNLDQIGYNRENEIDDNNIIKYEDTEDNVINNHLDLRLYRKKNNNNNSEDYLIICDEKGYFRIFNFQVRKLEAKIHYLDNDTEWKDIFNVFFVIRENYRNIILIKYYKEDDGKEINFEKGCDLKDKEIISYKKYIVKEFPQNEISLSV